MEYYNSYDTSQASQLPLTDDEFNSFHRSDRAVFSRLVFVLRRDPAESSRVMALWIWLEHAVPSLVGLGLIPRIILPLPDLHLDAISGESVAVLRCVEAASGDDDEAALAGLPPELPFLDRLVCGGGSALRYFRENCLAVVRAVAHRSASVCLRAFGDIMRRAEEIAARMILAGAIDPASVLVNPDAAAPLMVPKYYNNDYNYFHDPYNYIYNYNYATTSSITNNSKNTASGFADFYYGSSSTSGSGESVSVAAGYGREDQAVVSTGARRFDRRLLLWGSGRSDGGGGDGIREIARGLDIRLDPEGAEDEEEEEVDEGLMMMMTTTTTTSNNNRGRRFGLMSWYVDYDHRGEHVNGVPVDERTIFLTFSKGYPITEKEVRDFFTSKFGDQLIEAIYMQDVRSREEQPLYARLVVRSLSLIDIVLDGQSRKKFSIAGKHVWARKYVRKNIMT